MFLKTRLYYYYYFKADVLCLCNTMMCSHSFLKYSLFAVCIKLSFTYVFRHFYRFLYLIHTFFLIVTGIFLQIYFNKFISRLHLLFIIMLAYAPASYVNVLINICQVRVLLSFVSMLLSIRQRKCMFGRPTVCPLVQFSFDNQRHLNNVNIIDLKCYPAFHFHSTSFNCTVCSPIKAKWQLSPSGGGKGKITRCLLLNAREIS